MIRIFFFLYLFLAGTGSISCFAQEQNCIDQVRKMYDLMKYKELQGRKVHYMKYVVTMVKNRDGKTESRENEVEVFANKERTYVRSDELEVYQDSKTSVSIVPQRKIIMINDRLQKSKEASKRWMNYHAMLQDSLFAYATEENCSYEQSGEGLRLKRIRIRILPEGVKKYYVTRIDCLLNEEKKKIEAIEVVYDKAFQITRMKFLMKEIADDYKTDKLDKPVLALIFGSNKNLNQRYKNYQLIDNRKSSLN